MHQSCSLLALREIEQRLNVAERLTAWIDDPRDPDSTVHPVAELMIAAGYEDGIDAIGLRTDPLFKLALERLPPGSVLLPVDHLATGEPAGCADAALLGRALVDVYCGSFRQVPRRIT